MDKEEKMMFILSNRRKSGKTELGSTTPNIIFNSVDEAINWIHCNRAAESYKWNNKPYPDSVEKWKEKPNYTLCEYNYYESDMLNINAIWEITYMTTTKKIDTSHLGYNFDVEMVTNKLIESIQKDLKGKKVILGVSGGKDSTIAAVLLVKALGKENVTLVTMPNTAYSIIPQDDNNDIKKLSKFLDTEIYNVGIFSSCNSIKNSISNVSVVGTDTKRTLFNSFSDDTIINLPARVRMTTLFALGQTLGARVINTCNLSEDMIGYSTLYGDLAGCYAPLKIFTVSELLLIGQYLGIPKQLVYKTPSDGLSGDTDENRLGFLYSDLDSYIRRGTIKSPFYEDDHGNTIKPVTIINKMLDKYISNKFKLEIVNIPGPSLFDGSHNYDGFMKKNYIEMYGNIHMNESK